MSDPPNRNKNYNPYLNHLRDSQLVEGLVPLRAIRDVNDPTKVIYVDETRARLPDPPDLGNLISPMEFFEPDAIDLCNIRVLRMKGLYHESTVPQKVSAPVTPVIHPAEEGHPAKESKNPVSATPPDMAKPAKKSTEVEVATYTSEEKTTPYDTAQQLINRFYMRLTKGVLHIFNGKCYRPYSLEEAQHFIVKNCRSQVKAAGTPSFPKSVYECLLKEPSIVYDSSKDKADRSRFVTFENGTLDLQTGHLQPHSPEFFTTYCLNCQYNPKLCTLSTPAFDAYLNQVSGGDVVLEERILQFIGYTLVPDLDGRAIFLLQGYSGAGKSLLSNFLRSLFPEAVVSSLNVHELGDKFAVAELSRKIICISPDLPAGVLDDKSVSALKKLSGHDKVSSDVKFQSRVEFECEATFVLATNHMLCTKRKDDALIDRIVVIPFAYPVAKEARVPSLLENLKEEKDGIVNRAFQAYRRLKNNHYIFAGNYEINAVTEADSVGNDIVSCVTSFVQNHFIADPESGVFVCDAYDLFCRRYLSITENQFSHLFYRLAAQKCTVSKIRTRKPEGKNPLSYIEGIRLKKEGE